MTMKELSTGLQHIGLPTDCMDATIEFYQKLGFEIAESGKLDSGERVVFLKLGDLVLESWETKTPARIAGAVDHIAINVKDVNAAYECVTELGLNPDKVEIGSLPFWANGVSFFVILGPNDEKVEFNQYL